MHVNYLQEVKRDRFGRAGLLIIGAMVVLAAGVPVFTMYQPNTYTGVIFSPPSAQYWLGTNDVGQDILTRLFVGARTSLTVGFGVAFLSACLSLLVGCTAALFGGLYDRILMRVVDVFIVIPPVIVIILIAAYLRPNLFLLIILLSSLIWPGGARIIRAQTLAIKGKMHVKAARTFGAGWIYIMRRHIIPDLGPVLTAVMIQCARRAVFMEAGLSFLGIADPAAISWGMMMQHALKFSYLEVWKWWLLPIGIALSLTIMAFAFIGFALENALNPRLRKKVDHIGG